MRNSPSTTEDEVVHLYMSVCEVCGVCVEREEKKDRVEDTKEKMSGEKGVSVNVLLTFEQLE